MKLCRMQQGHTQSAEDISRNEILFLYQPFCTWENIICVAANNGTNDFFTRKGWVRSISDSAHRITTTTTRPHTQPQDGIYTQKWHYVSGVCKPCKHQISHGNEKNRWQIRNLCSQNTRRKTSSHYIYQSHVCLDIINEQWSYQQHTFV